MDELAGLLSRERRLLEVLLFKLITARHLLAAGESRFLTWAAAEVERATERVRDAEVVRASLVQKLARSMGLPEENLTLGALAKQSPEPYRSIFDDHRSAFFDLVAEVEEVTKANRHLAQRGMREVSEVLEKIDMSAHHEPAVRLYGPDATTRTTGGAPARFDGAL